MKNVIEFKRHASLVPKPQAIAWDGLTLWIGSRETKRLVALDPRTWTVRWETAAPGTPWGMTALPSGELRVLCGEGSSDTRIIRRCEPGKGFDAQFAWPCPDDSGSHLSFVGSSLVVSQWYPKKLITLDPDGNPLRVLSVSRGICGHCFANGAFWCVTTDAEETNDYWLTRVDPNTGENVDVARVGFQARGLAFDGENFWTNHREQNQTVCFGTP